MAAKKTRKPAIEKPEGIIDDILAPVSRYVARKIPHKFPLARAAMRNKASRHEMSNLSGYSARSYKKDFVKKASQVPLAKKPKRTVRKGTR